MIASTSTAYPYSFCASTSQMKIGTPMKRNTVRKLGTVKIRSRSTCGWPGREPAPMNLIRSPSPWPGASSCQSSGQRSALVQFPQQGKHDGSGCDESHEGLPPGFQLFGHGTHHAACGG